MSEGAHHRESFAPLSLRLSDQRRPFMELDTRIRPGLSPGLNTLGRLFAQRTPRPKAGGGSDAGADR